MHAKVIFWVIFVLRCFFFFFFLHGDDQNRLEPDSGPPSTVRNRAGLNVAMQTWRIRAERAENVLSEDCVSAVWRFRFPGAGTWLVGPLCARVCAFVSPLVSTGHVAFLSSTFKWWTLR